MTSIKDQGPKLVEADVAALEEKLAMILPAPYRRFLLTNNGGVPVPDSVEIPGFGPTDVQVFFGLGRDIESSCIDWNLDTFKERLESLAPRLLPVACDSGGNIFCLSLRPADAGAVVYLDLEAVYADYGKPPPMYRVKADFDQFLAGLHPWLPA